MLKKRVLYVLYATVLAPVLFLIAGFGLAESPFERKIFGSIVNVARETSFFEIANYHLTIVIVLLPIQLSLIVWMVYLADIRDLEKTKARLLENGPLLKIGPLILIRQKYGLGLCSMALFALIFVGMFYIGGDLSSCKGCATNSKFMYLFVNTAGVISMLTLATVFSAWIKLIISIRK